MLREIKYLCLSISIVLFFFFIIRYYISDDYKKKSFKALSNNDERISEYVEKLPILENDTENVTEYLKLNKKKKKKFNFWNLIEND
tara:strand:+ start:266 stop:523 length:258 start_codon:yes stop_codon:yes gene_type:complete